jgi:hypothetical protein
VLGQGLSQDALEGAVVAVLLEQGQASHPAIEGVIHVATRGLTRVSRHAVKIPTAPSCVKKKVRVPFFSSRHRNGLGTRSNAGFSPF